MVAPVSSTKFLPSNNHRSWPVFFPRRNFFLVFLLMGPFRCPDVALTASCVWPCQKKVEWRVLFQQIVGFLGFEKPWPCQYSVQWFAYYQIIVVFVWVGDKKLLTLTILAKAGSLFFGLIILFSWKLFFFEKRNKIPVPPRATDFLRFLR